MSNGFRPIHAFNAYRTDGLSAFEAHVGARFDRAAFDKTGTLDYGLGLRPGHEAAFRAAVVSEGEAYLARLEAQQAASAASARTSTNAELADALTSRAAALGGLAAHDLALIEEAARRLRAR